LRDPQSPDPPSAPTRTSITPTESFSYDADGDLTGGGTFAYTWNGESDVVRKYTWMQRPVSVPEVAEYQAAFDFGRYA
jgi:hypothetical protein